ncbi:MAG TPA: haloacid dehalogenase-like hydrolase [Streptosporangiaceae bacterium]|nr:haloacid dehalogenase-like hydrolase [Streptosporangiaceae bacterium]
MWNIDLTLMDVARVSRDAYAEAFRRVTGRPLVALPQLAGASDSEIFFEALALNAALPGVGQPDSDVLLDRYCTELAYAFRDRRELLASQGRMLPGAQEALDAVSRLPGVIQTVLTGTIRQNAAEKLRAFDLAGYVDLDIGGFGSDVYPKGTQILRSLAMAAEKYRVTLSAEDSVYVADSTRDVAAARVVGARCIGVATGRSTASELRDSGASEVLDDLARTSRLIAAIGP